MTRDVERLHVVGAGLIGASIALAARSAGWRVTAEDTQPDRVAALEQRLGGRSRVEAEPDVVCVAVPPAAVALSVQRALSLYVDATVMDVASVKARPLAEVKGLGCDLRRYVPSHPLAGSELSGPAGARSELFRGRTWVVCPDGADAAALTRVEALVRACGATSLHLSAGLHDRVVAVTSHLPQLLASALAGSVDDLFTPTAGLPAGGPSRREQPSRAQPLGDPSAVAGPALLDMTRVAASPAALWADIAEANRAELRPALHRLLAALQDVETALATSDGTRRAVTALVEHGARGRARISPKHLSAPVPDRPRLGATDPEASWVWVDAVVDDAPGALARLFQVAGALNVNIEDLHVDHAPHAATGVVSMAVRAHHADRLRAALATGEGPATDPATEDPTD
ncbi:MAG TPA: prephenate dehydrogenase/arogenate dehydrogenase family protein [Mycobacteriales bacterium]